MFKRRTRDWTITILFGLAAIFLQTTFLHSLFGDKIEINLIFGLIIWLAFYKKAVDSALLSCLLAFLQGTMSGVMSGVYMLAGMSLYLACWMVRDRFAPRSISGQFLFALAFAILYKLVMFLSLEIFVGTGYFRSQPFPYVLLEILLNAFFAPLIFMIFDRFKGFFDLVPDMVELRRG
jgi:rod shape-determining protein MreD